MFNIINRQPQLSTTITTIHQKLGIGLDYNLIKAGTLTLGKIIQFKLIKHNMKDNYIILKKKKKNAIVIKPLFWKHVAENMNN